ncbi:MAG: zf-HC2 domain-containing protein [Oscillospiraceae bacterium]|nr:zf-HC2 domain-containing protein [Oscillospiraceae bacterium]
MSKNTCELINDLLPLYADNVCSEESKAAVAEHIADCDKCRTQLEKMGRPISVDPAEDIAVMKRIKKRIHIEKIVIGALIAVVVMIALFVLNFFLFAADFTMDYYDCNLAKNIAVEEDENGDVWLIRKNEACEAWHMFPNMIDANGNTLFDKDFDKNNIVAQCYTLKVRGSTAIGNRSVVMGGIEEQEFLFNKNDKPNIETIYYYDDTNDEMYVLWERG